MDNIDKTQQDTEVLAPLDFTQVSNTKARIEQLENTIDELNKLCSSLDPYAPFSEKTKKVLRKYYITDYYDPFVVTNKLLVHLEDSIEELHKLQQNLS
ncbi:MAG: hypothetical protein ISR65_19115 [Bacteriovoracaceae bacterium]|nr:hypothetical protein [Bacteriovoracaceae bacterium]